MQHRPARPFLIALHVATLALTVHACRCEDKSPTRKAEARAKRLDVLAPFHERLQKQIEGAKQQKGKWWPEPEEIGEACPDCGAQLTKRWGKNGAFIGCPRYPECKYARNIPVPGEESREGLYQLPLACPMA